MDCFKAIKIDSATLYKNDKYEISNITVNEMLVTALSKFNIYNVCAKSGLEVVLLDELNNELSKYVKKTLTMDDVRNNKGASMGNPYDYSYTLEVKDDKRIAVYDSVCGALFDGADYVNSKVVKGVREGDYAYIYEKVAFARYNPDDPDFNKVDYYTDYAKTSNVVETIPSKDFTDMDGNPQSGSTPNWDLYNTYKYTFKLIDGYFYFQSVELVK